MLSEIGIVCHSGSCFFNTAAPAGLLLKKKNGGAPEG